MDSGVVGWVGAGIMGSRMVRRLVGAGIDVRVYARDPAKLDGVMPSGMVFESELARLATTCTMVVTIVDGPVGVESVYLGPDGLVAHAREGSLLVDMTTSSPSLARRIAQLAAARGIATIDAPVSGGPTGAAAGDLSIMVGGSPEAFDFARPLLGHLGRTIVHHGPAGSGHAAKLANQIVVGSSMVAIAEAFRFAGREGLRPTDVLRSISAGIAGSPLVDFIWPRLAADDMRPGFRVDQMLKDLDLALAADPVRPDSMPSTALAHAAFALARELGYGDAGTQAVVHALEGLSRPGAQD